MSSKSVAAPWRRMIALVALDHFFAAVEQLDNPRLQGRPLGVAGSARGSVLLAVSPEARALGLFPGMAWAEARTRCPELALVVARPERYAEISGRLMQALTEVSPELEAFALDEAFLDLSHCQAYYRHDPERILALIRQTVFRASGLNCSVGISGDRTTARWAARQGLAEGGLVVPPDAAAARLAPLPLAEVCGIGPGIAEFLAAYGVHSCGDMQKIPIGVPARRFGNLGRRLWLMAQGRDPAPVDSRPRPPRPGSLLRTLPPLTRNADQLQAAFLQLADKLSRRLRRDGLQAGELQVGLRAPEGWRQDWLPLEQATDDARTLFAPCRRFLRQHWFGEEVQQILLYGRPQRPAAEQADFLAMLDAVAPGKLALG